MKNRAMVTVMLPGMLLGALAIGLSAPCSAQNALGGATRPKQNAAWGAATPGPVIGGAAKPGSVGSLAKPGPPGGVIKPGSLGGVPRQTPPITQPNKTGSVVTITKCAAGACVANGPKP